MSALAVALLDVPNELLLNISQRVDRDGLLGLSLTCHHLRTVAQETLIRTATLSPKYVWKLVNTLMVQPGLSKALTHLRLGEMNQDTYDATQRLEADRKVAMRYKEDLAYQAVLRQAYGSGIRKDDMKSLDLASSGLIVLFALATNLRSISSGTNCLSHIPLLRDVFRNNGAVPSKQIPALHDRFRTYVKCQLQELDVTLENHIYSYYAAFGGQTPYAPMYLQSAGFQQLKRLVAPYSQIVSEPLVEWMDGGIQNRYDTRATYSIAVLPRSLTSVCLTYENFSEVPSGWLDSLFVEAHFPNLRDVELRSRRTLWATAWRFSQDQEGPLDDHIAATMSWNESRLAFKTTFGTITLYTPVEDTGHYIAGDLLAALQHCQGKELEMLLQDADFRAGVGWRWIWEAEDIGK